MNSRFLPLGVVPGKQFSFSLTLVLRVQPVCPTSSSTTCVYYISMQRRYSVGELYYRNLVTNADHQSKKSGQNQDGQHPGVDQMF